MLMPVKLKIIQTPKTTLVQIYRIKIAVLVQRERITPTSHSSVLAQLHLISHFNASSKP